MKMKKVLSIFLSILLLTSFMLMSVFAEETLDGFEYEENSAENTVTITGYSGAEMEIQIPGTINGKPVTRIGANAFKGSGLSSIEIPASVTSIGSYAFSSCTNLNSVTFEEGSQLARIESSVFRESGLTSIKIPASVTSIGSRAFYSCTNLSSVTFEEGSQLDSIVSRAFEESGLTSIKIPASVTSVETMAFNNCNDLKSITFQGETAPNIDNATFSGCNNLAAIYVSVSCIAADSYKEGNWSGLWNQGKIQTQHVLSNVKAKEASCTEDGNKEYWKCANCSKYFSDKDGKTEISENSTVIEKTGHSMTHVEAKKASCTEDGNKEYWHCAKCDGYFFDNKGEDKTSQKETVIEKTGHNMTHVEAKEASCTEDGNKEYWKCANCDSYFLDKDGQNRTTKEETEIAKTGHSMTHVEAKKASCTEDGNKEYWHCAKCDGYFFDNKGEDKTSQKETVIEKTGHNMTHVEAKKVSCTEDGNKEYWHCAKCDGYFFDNKGEDKTSQKETVIEKTGHSMTHVEAKKASCTEDGNKEYWYCVNCGIYYADKDGQKKISKDETVIEKTGHSMTHVEAKEAGCTEDGNKEYWHCTNCNGYFLDKDGQTKTTKEDTEIEKTGHNMSHVEAKKASCTEDGNKEYWHCTNCDSYFSDKDGKTRTTKEETVIEKTGHSMTHVEAKKASCTEDGNKEYWHCTNCDSYFSDKDGQTKTTKDETVIAKTGHNMSQVEAKKASCTEDGNKEYWHCAKCDGYFFDNKGEDKTSQKETVIEKTGHNMTHVEAKEASCTEDGNKEYWHCSTCDSYFADEEGQTEISKGKTVIAKGHSMTHVKEKEASCTEDGNKEYWYCANCGIYYADKDGQKKISKDETVIAKTGHSIKHVEAAEAGFMEAGNIEYWYCPKCDTYFSDENLTVIISKEQTIVPPIGNTTDSELPKPEENPKQSTDLPQEDLDDTKDAGGEMIDNAKTGDDLDIGPWITVMLSAGLALSVAAVYRKKKN